MTFKDALKCQRAKVGRLRTTLQGKKQFLIGILTRNVSLFYRKCVNLFFSPAAQLRLETYSDNFNTKITENTN